MPTMIHTGMTSAHAASRVTERSSFADAFSDREGAYPRRPATTLTMIISEKHIRIPGTMPPTNSHRHQGDRSGPADQRGGACKPTQGEPDLHPRGPEDPRRAGERGEPTALRGESSRVRRPEDRTAL